MPYRATSFLALTTILSNLLPSSAQAGPLIDWLWGGRRAAPAYPVGSPVPLGVGGAVAPVQSAGYWPSTVGLAPTYSVGYANPGYVAGYSPWGAQSIAPAGNNAANLGTYYGAAMPVIGASGAGYSPPMCGGISAATLPQQVVTYVPNYSSSALRAPVTYYRPIMTTDPNTGAQVVAMSPCTSYQYMTQRVPALGQTALYGSYPPVAPPAAGTMPSYTLPSGGIPIAQNSSPISLPQSTITLPQTSVTYGPYTSYSTSYPATTTYQPGITTPPITSSAPSPAVVGVQNYATQPLGASPYYGNNNGGSAGTVYSTPSPSASSSQAPYAATPGYPSQQSYPSQQTYSSQQSYPSQQSYQANPVFPSAADPADSTPSLPSYNGLRPTLRSIVPEASPGNESASAHRSGTSLPSLNEPNRDLPVISPIPAPDGLEKPRWSPGLMREGDMTALRPVTRAAQFAGQSKKILWTSFESDRSGDSAKPASSDSSSVQWAIQLSPSSNSLVESPSHSGELRLEANSTTQPAPVANHPAKRYDNSGWKAGR